MSDKKIKRGLSPIFLSLMQKKNIIRVSIFCSVILLFLFFSYESNSFERKEIPEAELRKMDVLIANEIFMYNTNTAICQVTAENVAYFSTTKCRRDFFQYLSDQGYEVGNIVLNLFDVRMTKFRPDLSEYARLHRLAVQGDKSALCLAIIVHAKLRTEEVASWPYTFASEFEFVKKGAAMGLPVCLDLEAYAYQGGVYSYPKNMDIALSKYRLAASAGVYSAQKAMSEYFLDEGISDPNDPSKKLIGLTNPEHSAQIDKIIEEMQTYRPNYTLKDLHKVNIAFCWARIADKYKAGNVENVHYRLYLVAQENNKLIHPEYVQLSKLWDLRDIPYEQKPTKAEDCINMEKEDVE